VDSIISINRLTFIKGRLLLDVDLMVNKVVDYENGKNEKCLIFKVDFENVYDLLRFF